MKQNHLFRFSIIAFMMVIGVFWALVSAQDVANRIPCSRISIGLSPI